jgi:Mrp family chromosome partitioning ATPase
MDSAPVNAVSDTFLLLPYAHFTFLVVRAGDTPRRAVERAVELMARTHHAPSGVVLNYLPGHAGYGYYYHYAQKYEYNGRGRRKALTAGAQAVES